MSIVDASNSTSFLSILSIEFSRSRDASLTCCELIIVDKSTLALASDNRIKDSSYLTVILYDF